MKFLGESENTIVGVPVPVPVTDDERHMLRALWLAERGRGRTAPNPMVGAVIVKDGAVAGEGFHERCGGPHAEAVALARAGDAARGSTVYVTLEPCNHHGRTPPCTAALIAAGVAEVVIGARDPNPEVAGGGSATLESAGIKVTPGPYLGIAERQNEAYLKRVATGMPFVILKMAITMDGKSATRTGDSRWVTSDESRRQVHRMRSHSDAVMAGVGTVLADDPRLTVRTAEGGSRPLRVVVDGMASTPAGSRVADTAEAPTLVAVSEAAPGDRIEALLAAGVDVERHGSAGGRVDLGGLLSSLAARGVNTVLVEGGAELAGSLQELSLIDRYVFYIAPKIAGGKGAPGAIGGVGLSRMSEAREVEVETVSASGCDIRVVAVPKSGGADCSPE